MTEPTPPNISFTFETAQHGLISIRRLEISDVAAVARFYRENDVPGDSQIAGMLLTVLGSKNDGSSLIEDDVVALGPEELEAFAESFLQAHGSDFPVWKPTRSGSGDVRLDLDKPDREVPRDGETSALTHLNHILKVYTESERERGRALTKDIYANLGGWLDKTGLVALHKNAELSSGLREKLSSFAAKTGFARVAFDPKIEPSLKAAIEATRGLSGVGKLHEQMCALRQHSTAVEGVLSATAALKNSRISGRPFKVPTFPESVANSTEASFPHLRNFEPLPNPVHETNERLGRLTERFESLEEMAADAIALVASMNTAASSLLDRFTEGARSGEKAAADTIKLAKWTLAVSVALGLLALTVSVAMPVWQSRSQAVSDASQNARQAKLLEVLKMQTLHLQRIESDNSRNARLLLRP